MVSVSRLESPELKDYWAEGNKLTGDNVFGKLVLYLVSFEGNTIWIVKFRTVGGEGLWLFSDRTNLRSGSFPFSSFFCAPIGQPIKALYQWPRIVIIREVKKSLRGPRLITQPIKIMHISPLFSLASQSITIYYRIMTLYRTFSWKAVQL